MCLVWQWYDVDFCLCFFNIKYKWEDKLGSIIIIQVDMMGS